MVLCCGPIPHFRFCVWTPQREKNEVHCCFPPPFTLCAPSPTDSFRPFPHSFSPPRRLWKERFSGWLRPNSWLNYSFRVPKLRVETRSIFGCLLVLAAACCGDWWMLSLLALRPSHRLVETNALEFTCPQTATIRSWERCRYDFQVDLHQQERRQITTNFTSFLHNCRERKYDAWGMRSTMTRKGDTPLEGYSIPHQSQARRYGLWKSLRYSIG